MWHSRYDEKFPESMWSLFFSGSFSGTRKVSMACCNRSILQWRFIQVLKSFLNFEEYVTSSMF